MIVVESTGFLFMGELEFFLEAGILFILPWKD